MSLDRGTGPPPSLLPLARPLRPGSIRAPSLRHRGEKVVRSQRLSSARRREHPPNVRRKPLMLLAARSPRRCVSRIRSWITPRWRGVGRALAGRWQGVGRPRGGTTSTASVVRTNPSKKRALGGPGRHRAIEGR